MKIANKSILVTGANRGIGRAFVEELRKRGAKRVYAAARADGDATLAVTDSRQIERAAAEIKDLDILINNAGVAQPDALDDMAALQRHLDVNLFGTLNVTHAFLPHLERSRGAVINIHSIVSLAPVPFLPAYSISQAAAFSMTQSLRMRLAPKSVKVHAVLPGPVDTDMSRGIEAPKVSAAHVARVVLDAVEAGVEDIFPDPMSEAATTGWAGGSAKAFDRQFAGLVAG